MAIKKTYNLQAIQDDIRVEYESDTDNIYIWDGRHLNGSYDAKHLGVLLDLLIEIRDGIQHHDTSS